MFNVKKMSRYVTHAMHRVVETVVITSVFLNLASK
jgi:hypothetical protein